MKSNKTKKDNKRKSLTTEYNVGESLRKLSTSQIITSGITGHESYQGTHNESSISGGRTYDGGITGEGSNFNESIYGKFERIKDDINDNKIKLSDFNATIAKEYLSKSDFKIVIGMLISFILIIGGLFYYLSYKDLNEDVKTIKKGVNDIKPNSIKSQYEQIQNDTLKKLKQK